MKTKNIILSTIAAASMLTLFNCNEDFLDTEPTEFLTAEQVAEAAANNPGVIAGSMAGIYTLQFQAETGGTEDHDDFGQKGYDIYLDMLCGDMALATNGYNWYRSLTEYQDTQDFTQGRNRKPWRYYYRIIRSANTVIDALGGQDVTPALDANKWIMGQAKAIRAHSYFYLTQLYSNKYEPNAEILPLYTTAADQNGPKVTTQVIFDLMISDLTESITLLDGFTRTAKNQINKSVAQGTLAYVYAGMGNWTEVAALTNDVITSGGYTLATSAEAVGGFNDVNTSGWMWGVDITLDNGLDLVSWWGQVDVYTYSYAWAGDSKAIDLDLYNSIPANDIRKTQFLNDPSSTYYLLPFNKFFDPGRVVGGQRNVTTDYLYMRVAEMYLLNAEANARLGADGLARTSLKSVLDLRVPTSAYVDALSGQSLLDEVYYQTRLELWGEGKSYFAMKRNQAIITRGANHLSNVGVQTAYDDEKLTLEIPEDEIQNNPFIGTQN